MYGAVIFAIDISRISEMRYLMLDNRFSTGSVRSLTASVPCDASAIVDRLFSAALIFRCPTQ